jgi:ABC-2 type transport system permease protein
MRHPEFMRRFIALLRKEVRQMLRDKSNLAVGLLLPIALILLFGYGLSFDVKNAPVAVVLEDSAPDARAAVAGFQGTIYLSPVWVTHMTEAERLLRAGEVDAIVRVPQRLLAPARSRRCPHPAGAQRRQLDHRADRGGLRQQRHRYLGAKAG